MNLIEQAKAKKIRGGMEVTDEVIDLAFEVLRGNIPYTSAMKALGERAGVTGQNSRWMLPVLKAAYMKGRIVLQELGK